jgi:hypothetical protein
MQIAGSMAAEHYSSTNALIKKQYVVDFCFAYFFGRSK